MYRRLWPLVVSTLLLSAVTGCSLFVAAGDGDGDGDAHVRDAGPADGGRFPDGGMNGDGDGDGDGDAVICTATDGGYVSLRAGEIRVRTIECSSPVETASATPSALVDTPDVLGDAVDVMISAIALVPGEYAFTVNITAANGSNTSIPYVIHVYPADWWNLGYARRTALQLPMRPNTALTHFPFHVDLTGTPVPLDTLRFVQGNTLLPVEVTQSNDTLGAWVRAESLHEQMVPISVYSNPSMEVLALNPALVWTAYAAVFHLDTSGRDSARNLDVEFDSDGAPEFLPGVFDQMALFSEDDYNTLIVLDAARPPSRVPHPHSP